MFVGLSPALIGDWTLLLIPLVKCSGAFWIPGFFGFHVVKKIQYRLDKIRFGSQQMGWERPCTIYLSYIVGRGVREDKSRAKTKFSSFKICISWCQPSENIEISLIKYVNCPRNPSPNIHYRMRTNICIIQAGWQLKL